MAVGTLNKAQALNISIPNDISLVGFDGLPLFGLRGTGLTTVRQDIPMLCQHAVDQLMKQFSGQRWRQQTIVPTQLVVGDTCKKIHTTHMAVTLGG
jgi:LacI family transcriptional regulator/LacI family repressor for deo operon, udp, cdd, tsx, nupC, and nupG